MAPKQRQEGRWPKLREGVSVFPGSLAARNIKTSVRLPFNRLPTQPEGTESNLDSRKEEDAGSVYSQTILLASVLPSYLRTCRCLARSGGQTWVTTASSVQISVCSPGSRNGDGRVTGIPPPGY